MTIVPHTMYRFSIIVLKIEKTIIKFTWEHERSQISKETWELRLTLSPQPHVQFNMILLRPLSQNSLENILLKCVSCCWIQYSLHQLFPVILFGLWGASVTADHTFTLKTPYYFRIFLLLHWFPFQFCFYGSFLSFQTTCQREVHDPLSFSDSSAFPVNLIQMHINEKSLWRWLIVYICSWDFSHML